MLLLFEALEPTFRCCFVSVHVSVLNDLKLLWVNTILFQDCSFQKSKAVTVRDLLCYYCCVSPNQSSAFCFGFSAKTLSFCSLHFNCCICQRGLGPVSVEYSITFAAFHNSSFRALIISPLSPAFLTLWKSPLYFSLWDKYWNMNYNDIILLVTDTSGIVLLIPVSK